MLEYKGYQMVATDFFHRHYLVYDAVFIKVGSLDYKRGIWYFTQVSTGETWFGLSRVECIRTWIRSFEELTPLPCFAPRPFPDLKSAL